MLTGFEDITVEITDNEKAVAIHVARLFNKHYEGEENARTAKQFCKYLNKRGSLKMTDVRFRKMVQWIRQERLVKWLIASSKGYWKETDIVKINKYLKSREERVRQELSIYYSFKDYMKNQINVDFD